MLDTFVVSAPEGHAWPLEIDTVSRCLAKRFPGMRNRTSHAPVPGRDYLGFEIMVNGIWRTGADFRGGPLILSDGDAADWAPTVAWFLGSLPPGSSAVVMRESNPHRIAALPPTPDPVQIQQILESTAVE